MHMWLGDFMGVFLLIFVVVEYVEVANVRVARSRSEESMVGPFDTRTARVFESNRLPPVPVAASASSIVFRDVQTTCDYNHRYRYGCVDGQRVEVVSLIKSSHGEICTASKSCVRFTIRLRYVWV